MVSDKKWETADEESFLWRDYKQTGNTVLRNELVVRYLWLVKHIVNKMMGTVMVKINGRDEIEAAGNFGLIQAIERFEPDRGTKFETYAPLRIRGAICDWLRELDWIPCKVRSNARLYQKAVAALQGGSDQLPAIEKVAEYLHVSIETAHVLRRDAEGANHHFLQAGENVRSHEGSFRQTPAFDELPDRRTPSPLDELTASDRFDYLIGCLPDHEKTVMNLYYRHAFTMLRIGNAMGCSESRVSQIHKVALLKVLERARK